MTSLSENTVVTTSGGLVELGYKEKTTNVTITGTSTASPTTIIDDLTIVADGSPVIIEIFGPMVYSSGGLTIVPMIFIDGSYRWLGEQPNYGAQSTGVGGPIHAVYRTTLSAGVHTINLKAFKNNATYAAYWNSGTGNVGDNYLPSFIRVSKVIQASQFIVPLASAPLVTSLPSAPIDGQEIRYLADATNGVVWNLRYRAASASSYKWEFVGGSSLRSTGAGSSTNSTTPQTTNTPSITVPLAGDYDCSYGGFTQNTAYGVVYNSTIYLYKDNTSLENVVFVPVGTYNGASIAGVYRATSLTASQVLNLRYAVSTTSSTSSFGALFINATPIRVG